MGSQSPERSGTFLQRKILEHSDAAKANDQTFYPAQCEYWEGWRPYRRVWNGDPNSELPYQYPKLDLPMQCDGHPQNAQRMLVVANGDNIAEANWLKHIDIPFVAYHASDKSQKHHHSNSGKEAEVYLKYIVEHYDCLAKVTLFAHAHVGHTWHRRERLDSALKRLQWHQVKGFRPLNAEGYDRTVFLADPVRNLLGAEQYPPYDPELMTCDAVVNGSVYPVHNRIDFVHSNWISKWWDLYFGRAGMGPIPEKISFSMGAEFLVTRERIRARPLRFYLNGLATLLDFHENTELKDYLNAVAWENLWPLIFGENETNSDSLLPACELYNCSMSE